MKQRCMDTHCRAYKNYGGRGIRFCERWLNFENFLADMGSRPDGGTLDRIDNDRDYEPGNCRWSPLAEQSKNRRGVRNYTIDGTTLNMHEWSKHYGVSYGALWHWVVRKGEPFCDAVARLKRKAA